MKREIKKMPAAVKSLDDKDKVNLESDVKKWLQEQAGRNKLRWLLAHAYDGVIWGRLEDGKLITSHEVNPTGNQISPPLRGETLLQARLFAPHGELLLWRDGDNQWQARVIKDVSGGEEPTWDEAIDESQILWGTDAQPLGQGFTLMSDGSQELCHIVPLEVTAAGNKNRPLRFKVRHYIQDESDDHKNDDAEKTKSGYTGIIGGYARIVASRLVDLTGGEGSEQ